MQKDEKDVAQGVVTGLELNISAMMGLTMVVGMVTELINF